MLTPLKDLSKDQQATIKDRYFVPENKEIFVNTDGIPAYKIGNAFFALHLRPENFYDSFHKYSNKQ